MSGQDTKGQTTVAPHSNVHDPDRKQGSLTTGTTLEAYKIYDPMDVSVSPSGESGLPLQSESGNAVHSTSFSNLPVKLQTNLPGISDGDPGDVSNSVIRTEDQALDQVIEDYGSSGMSADVSPDYGRSTYVITSGASPLDNSEEGELAEPLEQEEAASIVKNTPAMESIEVANTETADNLGKPDTSSVSYSFEPDETDTTDQEDQEKVSKDHVVSFSAVGKDESDESQVSVFASNSMEDESKSAQSVDHPSVTVKQIPFVAVKDDNELSAEITNTLGSREESVSPEIVDSGSKSEESKSAAGDLTPLETSPLGISISEDNTNEMYMEETKTTTETDDDIEPVGSMKQPDWDSGKGESVSRTQNSDDVVREVATENMPLSSIAPSEVEAGSEPGTVEDTKDTVAKEKNEPEATPPTTKAGEVSVHRNQSTHSAVRSNPPLEIVDNRKPPSEVEGETVDKNDEKNIAQGKSSQSGASTESTSEETSKKVNQSAPADLQRGTTTDSEVDTIEKSTVVTTEKTTTGSRFRVPPSASCCSVL